MVDWETVGWYPGRLGGPAQRRRVQIVPAMSRSTFQCVSPLGSVELRQKLRAAQLEGRQRFGKSRQEAGVRVTSDPSRERTGHSRPPQAGRVQLAEGNSFIPHGSHLASKDPTRNTPEGQSPAEPLHHAKVTKGSGREREGRQMQLPAQPSRRAVTRRRRILQPTLTGPTGCPSPRCDSEQQCESSSWPRARLQLLQVLRCSKTIKV